MKQVHFDDNEKSYETTNTRTSLFINTTNEKGDKALYSNEI